MEPGRSVFGRLFDRVGIGVLVPLTIVTALFGPLAFFGSTWVALAGVALWGLGIGVHESIMAAAVAGMVPVARRGSAYGIFNTAYGFSWFAGSALMGVLYDWSLPAIVIFSVVAELVALPFFVIVRRGLTATGAGAQT